jgi:thiol-disulfide isomerase/thioredoxin
MNNLSDCSVFHWRKRMKPAYTLLFAAALALHTCAAMAQSLSTNSPGSDEQQLRALKTAVDDAFTIYDTATNDPGNKLWLTYRNLSETNVPRMFDLAKKDPASQTSFEVLSWIAGSGLAGSGHILTNRLDSLELLAQYQATNPAVGPLCAYIGHSWSWRWHDQPVVDFLQAVARDNPDRANRAQAIFSLGSVNAEKAAQLAELENWGDAPFYMANLGTNKAAVLAELNIFDSKSAAAAAEQQLQDVIDHYTDCRDLQPRVKKERPLLKEQAQEQLFELLHLSIGSVAPEIEAAGVDGKKFKLSDTRGKITVLSFWASWCGPCMQSVPAERALAERLKGQPFAFVGVNGDAILTNVAHAIAHEQMTWPSFWNGKGGPEGPISSAWNVHGWPTVYLIDANGILRFKSVGYGPQTSNELNGSVDVLMKEVASQNQ